MSQQPVNPQAPQTPQQPQPQPQQPQAFLDNAFGAEIKWFFSTLFSPKANTNNPRKCNYNVLLFLSFFMGIFGADRFYLGKLLTGILKAITFGGLGIWYLIDVIMYLIKQPVDAARIPVDGFTEKQTFVYGALTVCAGVVGLHYLYIGFYRLFILRMGLFVVWFLLVLSFGFFYSTPLVLDILFFIVNMLVIIWWILDLYLAVGGRVTHTADGRELKPITQRSQSLCLIFAICGGFYALDRFYLGQRVIGLLKIGTLCGFGLWYVLDILLALLNSHKDENGNPVIPD